MANSLAVNSVQSYVQGQMNTLGQQATGYANEIKEFIRTKVDLPDLDIDAPWISPTDYYDIKQLSFEGPNPGDIVVKPDGKEPLDPDSNKLAVKRKKELGEIPDFEDEPLELNLPTRPDAKLPQEPGNAPQLNLPTIPNAPQVVFPSVPTIQSLSIPEVPNYSIPLYESFIGESGLTAPSNVFEWNEDDYQSILLDEVNAQLLDNLLNGGYGINPSDELPLWERARERELLNANTTIEQVTTQMAAKGFVIPSGALTALIEGAANQAMEKISSLNRDIALKRADLYVQNRQFTIQQAKEVEQMLITFFGYRMERALKAAQFMAEFGIQVFNALVSKFNSRVEAAKAEAQIYEVRLRTSLAELEAYKVKIEGAKLSVEMQKAHVDIYRTQLEGVKAAADIYRTQLEGVNATVEIEKSKLDAFRTKVDVYTSQVQAKTAEFGMYDSGVKGELSKIDLFRAQAEAYKAEVEGKQARAALIKLDTDLDLELAHFEMDKWKQKMDNYKAQLEKAQFDTKMKLDKYQVDLTKYKAKSDIAVAAANTHMEAMKSNAQIAVHKASVMSTHIRGAAQIEEGHSSTAAGLSKDMFIVYQHIMSSLAQQVAGIAVELQQG